MSEYTVDDIIYDCFLLNRAHSSLFIYLRQKKLWSLHEKKNTFYIENLLFVLHKHVSYLHKFSFEVGAPNITLRRFSAEMHSYNERCTDSCFE